MAGRRPQPVTQATNPNPFMPPMPQQFGGPQQMSATPVERPMPPQMPQMFGGQVPQMGGNGLARPMPQQYGAPRTTNGKNGGYRPQQQFNPFGGGFGGGCNH